MASFPLPLPTSPKPLSSAMKPIKTKTKSYVQLKETHVSMLLNKPNNDTTLNKSYLHQITSLCKEGLIQEAFQLLTEMESDDLPVGPEIYGELLQGCVYERALSEGQQIHARILKSGSFFYRNEYVETKLLIFYAKCGSLAIAEELFLRQRRPNVFSWAAMIGLRSALGFSEKALMGFCEMIESGAFPDNFVVPNALKACSALQIIGFGKGIHGYVLKMGFGDCVYVLSSLVDFYGKCGVLEDARRVFDEMPERTVVSWNSMLMGFVQNGLDEEALELFYEMRIDNVWPTRVSISSFLSASANLGALDEGRQGHALAVLSGIELDNMLGSSIINFYCKLRLIEDAELVFAQTVMKDVVTWNLLISGYVQDGQFDKALCTCHQMRSDNLRFDSVTLSSIISACAGSERLELGKVGHGFCIRNHLESDVGVASAIIALYASCGMIDCAQRVFDVTTSRDLVLWNTLISAYAQCGRSGEALKIFYQMQLEGLPPNVISWNLVLLGFLNNGQVSEAQDMFSQMQFSGLLPNKITWSTLILGFAQNGYGYEAIKLFAKMQSMGLRPDAISIIGILLACTNIVSLHYGRVVHGHIMRRDYLSFPSVATASIDMYAKCGIINLAKNIYEIAPSKDLSACNAMISGYALHGQANEALHQYKNMQQMGIEPDGDTFAGLLSACSNAGLVDEGLFFFAEMVSIYRITPEKEHYGCIVTLLARCVSFREAVRFMSAMPLKPDRNTLVSLLSSCKEHYGIELGEYLARELQSLEPENLVNYATVSNMYTASGKRLEASKARVLAKLDRIAKNPERSWACIQIGNEVQSFIDGDSSHPLVVQIYETLSSLDRTMRPTGCFLSSGQIGLGQGVLC